MQPIRTYHPDHLGTATVTTDIFGLPYQYFLNLPFGETMAEQHSTTSDFESRYKFNGKELDRETGLYYYGARYYDPSISLWLSVDPLAEKYPGMMPYNYTMNNPVRYVDISARRADEIIL
jgi:RHS repeat-associated protein